MWKKIQRQGSMEAYQWLSSKSIRTWVDDDKRCKTRKNFFRNKATKRQQKRNIVSNASFKWSRLFWRASISWKEKITTLMLVFNDINNPIYYRKPRSEMGVTCVGRQKMKLGSKPLIWGDIWKKNLKSSKIILRMWWNNTRTIRMTTTIDKNQWCRQYERRQWLPENLVNRTTRLPDGGLYFCP